MNHINDRIPVTGAGGRLGRAVVEDLLRRGAKHVLATSHAPEKLGELQARGVEGGDGFSTFAVERDGQFTPLDYGPYFRDLPGWRHALQAHAGETESSQPALLL